MYAERQQRTHTQIYEIMEVREVIVGSEWMTWWKAMQEEKKAGRKAVRIADWLQIRKDSSAKVLGLDSSHSVNKSVTVKLVLSKWKQYRKIFSNDKFEILCDCFSFNLWQCFQNNFCLYHHSAVLTTDRVYFRVSLQGAPSESYAKSCIIRIYSLTSL